jgi:TonB family protein
MKKYILASVLLFAVTIAVAQTKESPLLLYYDFNWQPVAKGKEVFYSKAWPENGKWHKQDFYADDAIQMDGWYSDASFKVRDGSFVFYYSDGNPSRKQTCKNDTLNGPFETYYGGGSLFSRKTFLNGIAVDSGFEWNATGILREKYITDKNGNGKFYKYDESGRIVADGIMQHGSKSGSAFGYDDAGNKIIYADYINDSLVATKCIDNSGKEIFGHCILDRRPVFAKGDNGWRRFLERNLKYPEYAQMKDIQGLVTVQFLVSSTGEISDLKILSSPHKTLSDEVLRLMKLGPNWDPAILVNKSVPFTHIQNVTFRLE